MKRRYEEARSGGRPYRGSKGDTDGEFEIRLLIPSRAAGAIIGRGGENIQRMRTEFPNVHISIPDSNTPERVLTATGQTSDEVVEAINDISGKIDEVAKSGRTGGTKQVEGELRMLVHGSYAGAIIGRAGFKIKELREETNANIKVYSEPCPYSNERVIQLNGEQDHIVHCIKKIVQICDEKGPVKTPIRYYDTAYYDPSFIYDYGGYEPDSKFRGQMPAAQGPNMGGGGGGYNGYGPPGPRGGGPPRGGGGGGRGGGYGPPQPMGGPYGPGGPQNPYGPPRGPPPPVGQSNTTQVTIPDELAGIVIGKGGQQVARIRMESGAQIAIDPQADPNGERIITITGAANQIQMAQYLLQQAVRQSPTGRKYIENQLGMK